MRGVCFGGLLLIFLSFEVESKTPAVFQELINHAKAGETVLIPSGTYVGNFLIQKPLTLIAKNDVILDGKLRGTVLEVRAPQVHISGITIRNSGVTLGAEDSCIKVEDGAHFELRNSKVENCLFGIELLNSPFSQIEDCKISGYDLALAQRGDLLKAWYSSSLQLVRNEFFRGRDVIVWYSPHATLNQNQMKSSRYGIHFMYSDESSAQENIIENNSVGIYAMYSHKLSILGNTVLNNRGPSGFGIALKDSNEFKMNHNELFRNRVGIYFDNSPMGALSEDIRPAFIERNRIVFNDVGVSFIGRSTGANYRQNDFIDNWQPLGVLHAERIEAQWELNYWSDYTGIDIQGQGVGAIPYRLSHLADDLTDRYEGFKLFKFGPAMMALEFASRAIPWLKPDSKAQDPSPSMHPWTSIKRQSSSYSIFWVAIFFLFISWGLNRVMNL
ncbi:MAG: nitrous oxide reductase family maturation protein NosD [Deltaproteobacteria bacterium]|nr:nitrous oxide reductase family maturation protein NosD [Deltaproteobacteria bacterium]